MALPRSNMPLGLFNAVTLGNWLNKKIAFDVRVNLTIDKVMASTQLTVAQRIKIAGQVLADAVKVFLSRPVRKYKGPRSKRIQVDPKSRSKPGEYPRADTTRLLKSVYHKHLPHQIASRVGTNLLYAKILETSMDRSFLRRGLREMRQKMLLIVRTGFSDAGSNV